VDFWDLTKLLFRRWYIAGPLLLVSIAAAGWTGVSVQPDYIATSYVQLIPPTAAAEDPDDEQPRTPRNPWLELGLGSLSRAAALTVQDQVVLKQLHSDGFSENVVITLDNQQPIMTIEIIGESEEQATETSEEVVRRLQASVAALQSDYGASEQSFITARRLDRGDNIAEANSKVKRAMVAVAGVGVLLSAALTIGVDGLLRRRTQARVARVDVGSDDTMTLPTGIATPEIAVRYQSRPRSSAGYGASAGSASTPGMLDQRRPRPQSSGPEVVGSGATYTSGNVSERREDVPESAAGAVKATGSVRGVPVAGGPPVNGTAAEDGGSAHERQPGNGAPPANRRDSSDDTAVISVVPGDATIILPRSPVGRETWTPTDEPENGSRIR